MASSLSSVQFLVVEEVVEVKLGRYRGMMFDYDTDLSNCGQTFSISYQLPTKFSKCLFRTYRQINTVWEPAQMICKSLPSHLSHK